MAWAFASCCHPSEGWWRGDSWVDSVHGDQDIPWVQLGRSGPWALTEELDLMWMAMSS